MKAHEVKALTERIAKFNALTTRIAEIDDTLNKMRTPEPDAPCGATPFTGNTRESRRLNSVLLCFSRTLGGAPTVNISLEKLDIPASQVGNFIETALRNQREKITEEIEAL